MAMFYVETYRPPYPGKGVEYRVWRQQEFSPDCLSPSMTAVYEVTHCSTKAQAVALVIEHAARFPVTVRLVFGGKKADGRGE